MKIQKSITPWRRQILKKKKNIQYHMQFLTCHEPPVIIKKSGTSSDVLVRALLFLTETLPLNYSRKTTSTYKILPAAVTPASTLPLLPVAAATPTTQQPTVAITAAVDDGADDDEVREENDTIVMMMMKMPKEKIKKKKKLEEVKYFQTFFTFIPLGSSQVISK
ncbi:hypothetical protein BDA99DRAFT_537624 [Phascolomyces articulosus]|uniref:Uncharacterized protein n=1 Tax=Phascolomyces articulosus TaxID=60185 RepID=A0AAD5PDG9_9FUNG|nr:hypothetical protein BDA99DRAFT_537624 [Phascolomyces articulosus]